MRDQEPFRFDFYQSSSSVTVSIYVKNIIPDTFKAFIENDQLSISFEDGDGTIYERTFNLFHNATSVITNVSKVKAELALKKELEGQQWNSLEKLESGEPVVAPKYPSSARKPLDLEQLDKELAKDASSNEQQMDDFFKQLYKDADEDTRKAMMKSFSESGGTVLSTNWEDVKKRTVEPSPPDGMERMIGFQRLSRRLFNTKPAKRSPPKLAKHLPESASEPIVLDNGCTFIDLTAKTTMNFERLPPMIRNYAGKYVDEAKIAEMKALHSVNKEQWTVTQLAKKFEVSRSFIISNIFTPEERDAYNKEIDEAISLMSIKQQKGTILRHKIRDDRLQSW